MVIKRNPKTGKYYIAPSPPSFYKSKPSAPTSSKKSSGSSYFSRLIKKPTYDTRTQTYTDSSGNKSSMSFGNALKQGATITRSSGGSSRSSLPQSTLQTPTAPAKAPVKASKRDTGTVTKYVRTPDGGILSEGLGLGSLGSKISGRRGVLRTAKERNLGKPLSALKELELMGLAGAGTIVNFGRGVIDLPETAYRLARNPGMLKNLPSAIDRGGKEFGTLLRTSPGEAFIQIGGEILLMKGTGAGLSKLKNAGSNKLTKLNPKYVGEAKIGETLTVKTGIGKPVKLEVVGKIPTETLASQVSKAGKTVKSVISSQADSLLGVLRSRGKLIRKPIPGEANFNKATKTLLSQFDKGIITKKNLIKLDTAIKKQGAKGLLERSFFADPTGKIRPSRLGVIKEKAGNLVDALSEDITFRKSKPQILLFQDVKVQSLPKAIKTIYDKAKKGATLTKKETGKLLEYNVKKTGKFKGVGFLSGESELTLAPGELIKRVKKVGVTIAEGKSIPIVTAKVFKATGKIKTLITQFEKGVLSKAKVRQLDKMLKKATGFNYALSSAKKVGGRYVSINKISAGILSKLGSKKKTIKTTTIKPKTYKPKTHKDPGVKPKPKPKPSPKPKSKPRGRGRSKTPSKKKPVSKTISKPKIIRKPISYKKPVSRRAKSRRAISLKRPTSLPRKKPKSPRSPKSPKSPKSPRSPKSPKSPKSPRSPKSPKSPKSPRSPKSPKSPKSPRSPARPGTPVKPIPRLRKTKKRKVVKRKVQAYNVYARPLKKRKGQKIPKLIKINKVPLGKTKAKNLRNYITDTSLSRTARLRKTKGKPGKTKLNIPSGYAKRTKKKFRTYRIVKGKRKALPKGKVIERRKRILDTRQEKKQITLRRRVKQITKPKKRKVVKRTVRKVTRPTRTTRKPIRRTAKRTAPPKRKKKKR